MEGGRAAPCEEADWDRLLDRVRAGAELATVTGKDGMPTRGQWRRRRQTDADFAGRADEALAARGVTGTAMSTVRWAEIVERLSTEKPSPGAVTLDKSLPSHSTIYRRMRSGDAIGRQLRSSWQMQRPRLVTSTSAAQLDAAVRAIAEGRPLRQLGGLGLPSHSTIARYRRLDPRFDARVRAAAATYRPLLENVAGGHSRALSQNEVWAAVNGAVSRGLPSFIRDDVVSEMVADVLEGQLDMREVRSAAGGYVAAYHREASTWSSRSFDAELGADGGRTLHDIFAG